MVDADSVGFSDLVLEKPQPDVERIVRWTIEDVVRVQRADPGDLNAEKLRVLMGGYQSANSSFAAFPHMLTGMTPRLGDHRVVNVALRHGANVAALQEAYDASWGEHAKRFQYLAGLEGGPLILLNDREGTTTRQRLPIKRYDGTTTFASEVSHAESGLQVKYPDRPELNIPRRDAIVALDELSSRAVIGMWTGQSGVGRDFTSEEQMCRYLDDMVGLFAGMEGDVRHDGAIIDAVMYCPHHPGDDEPKPGHPRYDVQDAYRFDCGGRKGRGLGMVAEYLMFLKGVCGVPVNWDKVVIGDDKAEVVLAADAINRTLADLSVRDDAPVRAYLVRQGYDFGTTDAVVEAQLAKLATNPPLGKVLGLNNIGFLPDALARPEHYEVDVATLVGKGDQ